MLTLLTTALLALALGARHAVEPDHLAAVGALVAEGRGTKAAARTGALWGLGHTLSLMVFGGTLLAVRLTVPGRVDDWLELLVALTLLFLGGRAMHRAFRPHPPHRGKPLWIGLIHGLAGTGALTAVLLGSLPSWWAGLWFIAWFGLGTIAGMMAAAGAAGFLFRGRWVTAGAGALSLGVGLVKGWPLVARLIG